MKTGNALPWSFYGLCLTLAFLAHVTGVQLPEPPPVDCSYSRWSPWTPCNPCTNMRRRSRGIDAFGQFAGQPCQEALSGSEACTTDAACVVRPSAGCSAADFQCGSGACIKKRLACNYDFDCEDQTDEDVCGRMSRKPCGTRAVDTQYRGGSAMGQGINILGPTPSKRVLYNGYFGGVCQFSGSSGIRVPWNVAWLNLETHAEKTVSVGVYASSQRLVREVLTESRVNVASGLSFRSTRTQKSVGQETKNVIKEIVKESPGKSKGYVRVKAKVQSATYRLRPRDLRLADGFPRDVESLPVGYEKGSYFDFIEDYGTHYARSGRLGGQYELVYILNTDQIRKRSLTEIGILPCFRDVASNTGVGATGSARTSSCILNKDDWKAVVDKVLVSVEGGDLASVSAMEARINTDGQLNAETYQDWARSIANDPGLLYSEQDPIYNAFPLSMPDVNTRISNMKRAIADYVAEYSVCKCKPCHNNGTVILIDGTCSCLCTAAYEGLACQNHEADEAPTKSNDEPRPGAPRPGAPRPGAPRPGVPSPGVPSPSVPSPSVSHEGNWACWSGWSTCSGEGERSRRRACNVDGLPPGGVCSGEVTEAEAC